MRIAEAALGVVREVLWVIRVIMAIRIIRITLI